MLEYPRFDEEFAHWLLEQLHEMLHGARWTLSDRRMLAQLRSTYNREKKASDQDIEEHLKDLERMGLR